jgi:F0F1-type ATP synthase membrane subunit c/vacuolar-type H+-ATPase subunit K
VRIFQLQNITPEEAARAVIVTGVARHTSAELLHEFFVLCGFIEVLALYKCVF